MGKLSILTKEQEKCLDQIRKNEFIKNNFYFTGGTVLSEYYLQHRYSEDIDFFTDRQFNRQIVIEFIEDFTRLLRIKFTAQKTEIAQMFFLKFSPSISLKIDFVYEAGKRLKKGKKDRGIMVDSFLDIAVNKLTTINDRLNVKDFVDYYFISKHFSVWDLIEGARIKYRRDIDPWLISSDFLGVESFTSLPTMIKPLTLDELKNFFREKAKELGEKAVER